MNKLRHAVLLAACLSLCGCAGTRETLGDWFGDKDAGPQPAKLIDIDASLAVRRVWQASVGKGTDKEYLTLRPALGGDGTLYVASRDGRLAAFDSTTGKRRWDRSLRRTRISGGPGLGENLVLVGTGDGEVLAFDAASGEQRWASQLTSEVLASPVAAGGIVAVRTGDGKVFGLNAATGNRLWVYDREVPVLTLRGTGSPVVAGGNLIAGFDNGRLVALEMSSGRAVWEATIAIPSGRTDLERMVDLDSDPVLAGDTVYVATYQGQVAAVSVADGRIEWSRELSSYAGLAIDSRNVYVAAADGSIWALDRLSGASSWRQEALSARQLTAPATAAGQVVVGDLQGYLHFLNGADGSFSARERHGNDPLIVPVTPAGGTVIAYSTSGRLAAYRID